MNIYALPADGDYYQKRICHYALATKNDVNGIVKKKVTKSNKNYDSDP